MQADRCDIRDNTISNVPGRTNTASLRSPKSPVSNPLNNMTQHSSPLLGSIRHSFSGVMSVMLAISAFLLVSTTIIAPCTAFRFDQSTLSLRSLKSHVRAVSNEVLEDFQVYPPVLTVTPEGVLEITDGSSNASVEVIPRSRPTCQQTLVVHSFALSYNEPFVGPYTPPPCSFNRVTWNLTVLSTGRQFDRLGTVSFGDIELFRSSTAEPTANGIEWTYLKVLIETIRKLAALTF